MDEKEILAKLRAHVAERQGPGYKQEAEPSPPEPAAGLVASSNISRHVNEVWAARDGVGQLNPRNPGIANELAQRFKRFVQRSLSWYTRSLQNFNLKVARALEEQGTAIISVEQSVAAMQRDLHKLRAETAKALANLPARATGPDALPLESYTNASEVAELAVQEQQSAYVELFRGLPPVLDAGCGRGEFLQLLKMTDIVGFGVDSDPAACRVARSKRLDVFEGDLIEYLRNLHDKSLGGIFCARVIEYLPSDQQIEFAALSAQKLRPGGLLVIETRNPDSALGFGRTYHLDATHMRSLHPELLKAILESHGLEDVRICSLTLAETLVKSNGASGGAAVAQAVAHAPNAPAYAAVARRP